MRKSYAAIACTLLLAFLIPAAALAADKTNSTRMLVPSDVVLNGAKIPAGNYTFQWTDSGKVTVLSGKKTVATADAKVVPGKSAPSGASLLLRSSNGAQELTGVRLKNGTTLDFTGAPSSSESGAGGASPRN